MDAYLLDWANLLLRWAHVIVAIAWIGSSFYFVFLDSSLTRPTDPALLAKGVDGELWAVHGGGFYHPQKYLVAPPALPANLHWFYWESYSTWLTGFGLFAALYLFQADSFLVDRQVHDWSGAAAGAAALGFLLLFWLLYDGLCRGLGSRRHGDLWVGAAVLGAVTLASWAACQLFAGRAAFVLVGAMLATAMSANVFFWIIPGQRKVIAQMKAGEPVDPRHGQRAKQRSVHNTYFTLPVLVAMLSNHYGWLTGAAHNWAVLMALMLAGALIRHSFVARHRAAVQGRPAPWGWAAAGCAILATLAWALAPAPQPVATTNAVPGGAELRRVLAERCLVCHNAQVQNKNVALHEDALIRRHAQAIYQQVVLLRQMPLNNATGLTEAERALIRRWYEAGAALP
ncbi:MAG: urate hydroxylase PuuD [Burkholderiaceae bacterium]|nr:urate hydroxylase PuuD [Burkholderiaceae bacterium]